MSACPSADVLSAFLQGTLNGVEAETVASHLRVCLVCDAMLSDLKSDPLALAGHPSAVAADRALRAESAGRAGTLGGSSALLEADAPPRQRLGPYELLEKLGQGGMGAVYKARHTKLKRIEAIKILPPHLAKDANVKNHFEREIQAVGALNHPNIVQARHADEADGQLYLVMEYVDGRDVASLIKQHGPLPIADACEIIHQAALGLQHAHEHGLVHRDIKPSNLMLARDSQFASQVHSKASRAHHEERASGRGGDGERIGASPPLPIAPSPTLKILDLGLARLDSATEQLGELTSTGQIMGTLDYMAPEQGGDAHQVDIRADLYSLGATLYHLLSGQPPFPSPKYKTAAQKLQALTFNEPTPIRELRPEVPEPLAAIVHRMLAKQPDARFAVPHEVSSAIAPFTVGHNLAQLVATDSPPVADPELASTFHHASSAELGTGSNLECGDLSPLSIAAQPLSIAAQPLSLPNPQSGSAANQSGDKSPHSKWRQLVAALIFSGAAAFVLYGIVVIIRDKDGKERARLKLDKGDKLEIVNDESDSKPAPPPAAEEKPTAEAATPKKIVIGPLVPRPPMVPLDLQPLPIDIKPGSPMSPCTLVARPAPLDGVLSWTIELRQPRGYVQGLEYSPDGTLFASGGSDQVVRIWDAKTYELQQVLIGVKRVDDSEISSVSWSPDGRYVAAARHGDGVVVWNVASGRIMAQSPPGTAYGGAKWSPDGRVIALTRGSEVVLWDPQRRPERTLRGHQAIVFALAWAPDGRRLASGSVDKAVRVWEVDSGETHLKLEHGDGVNQLDWSPDGQKIASYDGSSTRIWSAVTGERLDQLPNSPAGNGNGKLKWSPDGRFLQQSGTKIWDAVERRFERDEPNNDPSSAVWSNDATTIIEAGSVGRMRRFDRVEGVWNPITNWNSSINDLAWSSDGRTIAVRELHVTPPAVRLWQTDSDRLLSPHNVGNGNVCWAPTGNTLAVVEGAVNLWDAAQGTQTATLKSPGADAIEAAWSSDGQWLASLDSDQKMRIWDVERSTVVSSVESGCSPGKSYSLTFSPDGKWLAVSAISSYPHDSVLSLWNTETWQRLGEPRKYPWPESAVWSPDSDELAIEERMLHVPDMTERPNADIRMRLWMKHNTRVFLAKTTPYLWRKMIADSRGESPLKHRHETDNPLKILWTASPDMKSLATSDGHGFIWLWDIASREPRAVLTLLPDGRPLAINAEGHYRSDEDVTDAIVYVVQTADGQQTLTPAEFSAKYGWQNDPSKVKLLAP